MDEESHSHINTIIYKEIGTITLSIHRPGDSVEGALPVLSLPGEHSGGTCTITGNGSGSSMVMGGEDVARAPSDISTSLQGLDEDGRHTIRAGFSDTGTAAVENGV